MHRCRNRASGSGFWIAGVPGNAVMVKVNEPSAMAPGTSHLGMSNSRNRATAIGIDSEGHDEQRDAAIGQDGAGQYDRQD